MILKSLPLLICGSVAFVVFAGLLVWIIANLLRSNRRQILASAPLLPDQELNLPQENNALILLEVPRFGSDHRGWELELTELQTNRVTRLRYQLLRASGATYGVTTMRVPFGRISLSTAGRYRLRVAGLVAGHDYSSSRIFFSRPYLARMVLQIIGIVICGVGMLLSLLLALWQIFPLQHG